MHQICSNHLEALPDMLYLVPLVHCCIIYPLKGHLRSLYDVIRSPYIFVNNFWQKRDRDLGKVPKCLSHQDASSDMQHDLLRSLCDLDLRWPGVKFTNWPFEVKKHISRSGLTWGTLWCQNYSPNSCSSEVIDKKRFPFKTQFWPLMTSGTHTIDGNVNLKAQIDS